MKRELYVGTMRWGKWGADLPVGEVARLIENCLEHGLTTFDSADIYGAYTTENVLGKAFAQTQVARESYRIITKCGILYPAEGNKYTTKAYDTSAKHLLNSVEIALKNLQTEYVDELLIHRPSPLMDFDEMATTLQSLLDVGKVKKVGVSNFTPAQFEALYARIPLSTNQIELSLYQPESLLNDDLLLFAAHKLRPQAWSPLGGLFSDSDEKSERIRHVGKNLCLKYRCTLAQLALAWLYKHPTGIIPVVGSSKWENIALAKEAQTIELETQDWFALLEASRGHRVA